MQQIQIGKLKDRIILQQRTITRGTRGETKDTWVDIATVWAAIEPVGTNYIFFGGGEKFTSNQLYADVTHKITIRYRQNITPAMRGKMGNRIFNFLNVLDLNERHEFIFIRAKEVV